MKTSAMQNFYRATAGCNVVQSAVLRLHIYVRPSVYGVADRNLAV